MRLIVIVILVVFFCPIATQAQISENQQRASLKGISSVDVYVPELPAEIKSDGLTENQIRTDVELKLRKAGISISKDAYPTINVMVTIFKTSPARGYAYSVSVTLTQLVQISTDKPLLTTGITWARANLVVIPPDKLRDVREDVADYIDAFINDYLAANPR